MAPQQPPLSCKVNDACARIGISRTSLYQLIKSGDLRAVKIAGRTLIPEEDLQRLISDRLAASRKAAA